VRQAVHLKVDTGMGRLGVSLDELSAVLKALSAAPHLVLEGLSTHLASSEIMDAPSVAEQERRFEEAQRMVRAAGFEPRLVHMANTSALISRRETWNNMVRPGVALYGADVEDAHSLDAELCGEPGAGLRRNLCDQGPGTCGRAARGLRGWV